MTMEDAIKHYLSKNKLSFSDELEKMFTDDYFQKTVPIVRIGLVLAFILYASFGILDLFMSSITKEITWFIRYILVCPIITIVFILSFFHFFKKIMQLAISIVALVMGFGIIFMITTARSMEGGLYYYAGLILVIIWSYTLIRLKFLNATIVCWLIIMGYEVAAIFFQGLFYSDELTYAFINNNFFFISSNILCMFASFYMERYTRRDFLYRLLTIENQKKIEEEKNILSNWQEVMNAELEMARIIQQQIIPQEPPTPYISAIFKPMEPIGGDFYDFVKFREQETTGIFISDVSGHGIPAALITTMLKSIISEAGGSKLDPSQLLLHLNEILVNQTEKNHVTAFYGIYNKNTRSITYSSAGHNPPFLIHDNTVTELDKARSLPLGIIGKDELKKLKKNFHNHVEILPEKSKLIFYTDGLTEARNPIQKSYYFDEIIKELLVKLSDLPCKEFISALFKNLVKFRGSENFDDDVCIICLDID